MNFNIISFGCKVNSYESEYMKEQLIKGGYLYSADYKTSDIVIINTCSVTNTADNKCKKMIRSVRRENSKCILMVCGCTSENNREKLNDLDIDIMIGNNEKSKVLELVENFIKDRVKFVKFYNTRSVPFENMEIDEFSDMTRAYVKIQDGCNNFCAYCIIPYVRGSIRSKNFDEAVNEIKDLVNKGHKEIVFTGINTGAYGRETGNYDLTDLIHEMRKRVFTSKVFNNEHIIGAILFEKTMNSKVNDIYTADYLWNEKKIGKYKFIVHKDQDFYSYENEKYKIAIVGHAYNPFDMKYNEEELLKDCIQAYMIGEDEFYRKISEFTGIHIIILISDEKVICVQDCSGIKSCYFGLIDNNIYITSHTQLVADICDLEMDNYVKKLTKTKCYNIGNRYLPGNISSYKELKRLGPNTSLNIENHEFLIKRFYCTRKDAGGGGTFT